MTAIAIERLSKVWPDGTVALRDVSLSVAAGEVVAILGGSGAGKSTLLRCASRLVEPTSGRVRIDGVEITALRGRALARARSTIGFVFQQFNLVRTYTALENVTLARISHTAWWRGLVGAFEASDVARARAELLAVGMAEKAESLARDLSGGQQQRVAIARAFAQDPKALFADEPTASLDPRLAATVLGLLREHGKRHAVPVLMNVHSVEQAREFADRVIGLRNGEVAYDGTAASLDATVVETIYGAEREGP